MRPADVRAGVELTDDRLFTHRVRRLVVVSAFALGVITWLAVRAEGPTWSLVALAAGWLLMPTILALSLQRPQLRYALVVPASLVTIGLFGMVAATDGSARVGWMLITIGILVGGTLGMWFWYRWMPVPRSFDDPYGYARLSLVGIHIGLVLIGVAIVYVTT